ncbi:hypothetical protein A6U87_14955 [Rhizobium sp. AC44/96]|uniref:hypothetical protein n=1 Tax=Rhizobium sp. AC44/96 TaxID=1841654 RepID=UPI0008100D89|nr:hypothetical protein [Rhizobium sp. AC44/96]OCJ05300.1 hypothetical protein A6U87_14955 [Rhizobium sp. AC44/96]
MNDWFRSWHGAPTDPKWLGIARRAGVAPGIAVAVAWALMDRASQASDRGSIAGYDAEGLAYFYGCEPEQVEAIVAAMADKGMITDGRFSSWEKRQPKREDGAAERAREWRERKRTQANASATTDTETDTDPSEDASAPEIDSDFDKFWDVYPNKVGEPAARKAFSKALSRASLDEVMAGARTYAAKTDDRQWCNPVKWLSEDRWKDQPGRPPDKPPPKPNGLAHLSRPQSREEYLRSERERSERSFR